MECMHWSILNLKSLKVCHWWLQAITSKAECIGEVFDERPDVFAWKLQLLRCKSPVALLLDTAQYGSSEHRNTKEPQNTVSRHFTAYY